MTLTSATAALLLAGTTAAANFQCETRDGSKSYFVDTDAQTITFNDLAALDYTVEVRPLLALFGTVRAVVDLPRPAHIASGQRMFTLNFGPADTIILTDFFSSGLSVAPTDLSLSHLFGVPCTGLP